ncbi:MAG: ABC transporter permease [Bacteroidota bacterium]|jgi:lipoprotein-releasing system permease protein
MLLWMISRRFARSLRADGFARFTSIVATLSISLGFIALCVSQSILAGYVEIIQTTAQRFGMYVTVQSSAGFQLGDARPLQRSIEKIPGVTSTRPVLRQETLVRHASAIDGAVITGLDSAMVADVFSPVVIEGTARPDGGVLIGSGLRDRLAASVGDTLTLITRTAEGDRPAISRQTIRGVFKCGIATYDDHVLLTGIGHARNILRSGPTQCSSVMITCTGDEVIPLIRQHVAATYRDRISVLTYRDHLASIWNWIELQRQPIPVILSLIAIVSVFTVVSSLILAIVAKTRSMAILSTLGMPWWRVAAIVGLRALTTTIVGLTLGAGVSLTFIGIQRTWKPISLDGGIYYVSHLPVSFDPWIIITSGLLILAVSTIASIVPMLIVARLRPASALRFR